MADDVLTALNTATADLFPDGNFAYNKEKLKEWKRAFDAAWNMKDIMSSEQMNEASDSGTKVMSALKTWRQAAPAAGGRRRSRRNRRHRGTRRR